MNAKTQLTVDVIAKVAAGKIIIANASKLIHKSRRTIERYLQRYRKTGIQFVIHGNTGNEPANRMADSGPGHSISNLKFCSKKDCWPPTYAFTFTFVVFALLCLFRSRPI